jgi:hypothetical protein
MTWAEVGPRIRQPGLEALAQACAHALGGVTTAELPDVTANLVTFGTRLELDDPTIGPRSPQRREISVTVLAAGLAESLLRAGWEISALPGEGLRMHKCELWIEPSAVIQDLVAGFLSAEAWRAQSEAAGIANLRLGARRPSDDPPPGNKGSSDC